MSAMPRIDIFNGITTEIELIQVIQRSGWFGLKIDRPKSQKNKPEPAEYPIERGVYQQISENECQLWVQGSVIGINQQQEYLHIFKEDALKPPFQGLSFFVGFQAKVGLAQHLFKCSMAHKSRFEQQHAL